MKAIEAATLGALAGFGIALWGLLLADQLSSSALLWKYASARDDSYVERQYLQGARCVQYRVDRGALDLSDWCLTACESKYGADEMGVEACKDGVALAAHAAIRAMGGE